MKVGEHVAGAVLTKQLAFGGGVSVWAARTDDAQKKMVCALVPAAGDAARDRFLAEAVSASEREEPIPGVLSVLSVDPVAGAYVGDLSARATLAELESLGWDTGTKIAMFRRVTEALGLLHAEGVTHGWVRPENVVLDTALKPFVANAHALDVSESCRVDPEAAALHAAYTAPEVRRGSSADLKADVYSLGRLLHFMLQGEEPTEDDEQMPTLRSLKEEDDSLVNIVRRCTMLDADKRYEDAAAISADLLKYTSGEVIELPDWEAPPSSQEGSVPSSRKSDSVKEKATPSSSRAERNKKKPKPKPEDKKKPSRVWRPKLTIFAALVGLGMLIGSIVAAYIGGTATDVLLVTSWLSGVPLGFAVPTGHKRALLLRAAAVTLFLTGLVFIDPVSLAESNYGSGLRAGTLEERVAALKSMRAAGSFTFRQVDLAGADLSGMDLKEASLDGSNLSDCKCSGVDMTNASTWNVNVTNADFSGANLAGATAELLKGWQLLICDDATTMPTGWACVGGRPELATPK